MTPRVGGNSRHTIDASGEARIIELYNVQNLHIAVIAKRFGVSRYAICRILDEQKLRKTRDQLGRPKGMTLI